LDYYQILRIGQAASRKEIEQAYNKLMKESRYDTSIDRIEIEKAYRILIDLPSKAKYDARKKIKSAIRTRAAKRKSHKGFTGWVTSLTLQQLLMILSVALVLASGYYYFRFGYLLQDIQAGDVIYDIANGREYGKVVMVEDPHDFNGIPQDGYKVQLRMQDRTVWIPGNVLKARFRKNLD